MSNSKSISKLISPSYSEPNNSGMIKVIAVMGSPRKGNSYQLAQKIENRLKKFGKVEFEYLFLKDIQLEPCRGCYVCMSKGEAFCPLKDAREEIEDKMLNSDGIIFVSPNYAGGVTSLMKNFIERFAYTSHRPRFFNRCAVILSTSGGPFGLSETLRSLAWFGYGGFQPVYRLGIQVPPIPLSPKAEAKNQKRIDKTTEKFYETMKNKKRLRPGFGDILNFRSFRALCGYNEAVAKKNFSADFKYWTEKGWLSKNALYFVDANINILKRIIGPLIEKIIKMYLAKNVGNMKE